MQNYTLLRMFMQQDFVYCPEITLNGYSLKIRLSVPNYSGNHSSCVFSQALPRVGSFVVESTDPQKLNGSRFFRYAKGVPVSPGA